MQTRTSFGKTRLGLSGGLLVVMALAGTAGASAQDRATKSKSRVTYACSDQCPSIDSYGGVTLDQSGQELLGHARNHARRVWRAGSSSLQGTATLIDPTHAAFLSRLGGVVIHVDNRGARRRMERYHTPLPGEYAPEESQAGKRTRGRTRERTRN